MPIKNGCDSVAFAGFFFEFLLVLLNIADVVSDCLVARQFYLSGASTFFWLVIASLILANALYTVFTVEVILPDNCPLWFRNVIKGTGSSPLLHAAVYVLIFPFAQMVPCVNFAFQSWKSFGTGGGTSVSSRVAREQLAADEVESSWIGGSSALRLSDAIRSSVERNAPIYMESVVEAIPQCIVQVVAMTALDGGPSSIQVVSLGMSMLSVISKGFVLSRSFDTRVAIFKMTCVAVDLCSLFYLTATIASRNSRHDVRVGTLWMSYISVIWLAKFVLGVVAALPWHVYWWARRFSMMRFDRCIRDLALYLLAAGPALVLVEGVKLLWLTNGLHVSQSKLSEAILLYAFVTNAATEKESIDRIRFVASKVAYLDADMQSALAKSECTWWDLLNATSYSSIIHSNYTLVVLCRCWICVYAPGQLFSLLFPMINGFMYYNEQNVVQLVCLFGTCASLFMSFLLMPIYLRYLRFGFATWSLLWRLPRSTTLEAYIAEYLLPPTTLVLRRVIPQNLLPIDVINVVAAVVGPQGLDLSEVTREACRQYDEGEPFG